MVGVWNLFLCFIQLELKILLKKKINQLFPNTILFNLLRLLLSGFTPVNIEAEAAEEQNQQLELTIHSENALLYITLVEITFEKMF